MQHVVSQLPRVDPVFLTAQQIKLWTATVTRTVMKILLLMQVCYISKNIK